MDLPDDQDWHIGTGSVFEHDGLFTFHYTGFCEGNNGVEGKNVQVVLRATSRDLKHWEKDKEFFFRPDTEYYGNLHWRDPHVIWNEELGEILYADYGNREGRGISSDWLHRCLRIGGCKKLGAL